MDNSWTASLPYTLHVSSLAELCFVDIMKHESTRESILQVLLCTIDSILCIKLVQDLFSIHRYLIVFAVLVWICHMWSKRERSGFSSNLCRRGWLLSWRKGRIYDESSTPLIWRNLFFIPNQRHKILKFSQLVWHIYVKRNCGKLVVPSSPWAGNQSMFCFIRAVIQWTHSIQRLETTLVTGWANYVCTQ